MHLLFYCMVLFVNYIVYYTTTKTIIKKTVDAGLNK